MSRYHAFFIAFLLASLLIAGWLFFAAMNYLDAAFDCADLTSAWEDCANARRTPIVVKAIGVVILWSAGLWLLLRERKKR